MLSLHPQLRGLGSKQQYHDPDNGNASNSIIFELLSYVWLSCKIPLSISFTQRVLHPCISNKVCEGTSVGSVYKDVWGLVERSFTDILLVMKWREDRGAQRQPFFLCFSNIRITDDCTSFREFQLRLLNISCWYCYVHARERRNKPLTGWTAVLR